MDLLNSLPIKLRLVILVGILSLMGLSIGLLGISGMREADQGMDEMYHVNVNNTFLMGALAEHLQELRAQLLLSLQHAPDNSYNFV